MSAIKGKETGLEKKGLVVLRCAGLRFRMHPKGIVGKPDAANKSKKFAVFFDSAFWHGYDWKRRRKDIKSNKRFWIEKIEGNMKRDKQVNRILRSRGWRVIRIWEYELAAKNMKKTMRKVAKAWVTHCRINVSFKK